MRCDEANAVADFVVEAPSDVVGGAARTLVVGLRSTRHRLVKIVFALSQWSSRR